VGATASYTATTYLPFETRVYDELDTTEENWLYPAITKVDGQGRVVEILKHNDYEGQFTQLKWAVSYDPLGNITSILDPKANQHRYEYDTLSRRKRITDPNAGIVQLGYDDASNLTVRRNSLGERVTAEYGQQNRLRATHVWWPDAAAPEKSYEFGYDLAGPGMPEAKNLRGQLAWASDPVSKMSWSYEEQGRVVAVAREVWDPGRSTFAEQQRDVYRSDLVLDPQGTVLSAEMPGGFGVTYGYNERSLLSSIAAGFGDERRSMVPLLNYDAPGARVRSDFANGTTSCSWFDARRRVVGRKATTTAADSCVSAEAADAKAFLHLGYGYTAHGLIESITDRTRARDGAPRFDGTYGYDRLYELTSAKTAEGTVSYRYDAIQNLIAQTATQGDTGLPLGKFGYGEHGAGPNAVTSAGRETFGYDAAGRMLGYHGFELGWDGQDRLTEARRADGTRIQNYYDFGGERVIEVVSRPGVAAEVHRYVFEGYQVHGTEQRWLVSAGGEKVAEINETAGLVPTLGQLDELVAFSLDATRRPKPAAAELLDLDGDGDAVDAADLEVAARRYLGEPANGPRVRVWRYYHSDHLGAPTHVSDSAGDWMSATRFHAYGRVYGEAGQRSAYGYAGSLRETTEELGLVRMGARWYAPEVGRWATLDPLFLETPQKCLDNSGACNLYSYANNSPIWRLDPEGTEDFPFTSVPIPPTYLDFYRRLDGRTASEPSGARLARGEALIDKVNTMREQRVKMALGHADFAVKSFASITSNVFSLVGQVATLRSTSAMLPGSGAACVGGVCPCFVAGTSVDTAEGPKAIEEVALGDRVGPEATECGELRLNEWSTISLLMIVSGAAGVDELSIRLLRPRTWLDDNQVVAGSYISVRLEELNIEGDAFVSEIESAANLKAGTRCPVTGLVSHISSDVIAVMLLGGASLELTQHHRLFSADRNGWIAAGALVPGERLKTMDGIARVEAILNGPRGPTEVFNLEVFGEHQYYVGELRVLAHNTYASDIVWKGFSKGSLATHFEKHGAEFGNITQSQYLAQAKAFAVETGEGFSEAQIGNFIVKFDPASRRMLVGHETAREIRTFYKAATDSSDPFKEAVQFARDLTGL
jgi:RHS repeat-associated protein